MATWRVSPLWKKSIIEYNHMAKDDNELIIETGWRGGSFYVYTDDDNPPELEPGVDIMSCGYESEMIETFDGCWEEYHMDDCDDETREWLEEFLEENSYFDLEEHGWIFTDCEFVIDCDMEIVRVNDDGTDGERITTESEPNTKEEVKFTPTAAWPFGESPEPTEYAKFKCEDCGYITEDIGDLVDNPNDDDKGALLCPECGGKVDLS
jgi:DNA-directed RNA polymerase subunit RPC12/RpoP